MINYLKHQSLTDQSVTARDELARVLAFRPDVRGEVFKLTALGMKPREIAARLEVSSNEFVYFNWYSINGCLDGTASDNAISVHSRIIGSLNSLLKESGDLSDGAQRLLRRNLQKVTDLREIANASRQGISGTSKILGILRPLDGLTGAYVYTRPSELERPVEAGRLMKVGWGHDIGRRLRQQLGGSVTERPEPMLLLRAYVGGDSKITERYFHDRLKESGHQNPYRGTDLKNRTGTEWFMTDLGFLDGIAESLGMRTAYALNPE